MTIAAHSEDEELSRPSGLRKSFFEIHNLVAMFFLVAMRGMLQLQAPEAPVARELELTMLMLVAACGISCLPDFVSDESAANRGRVAAAHIYRALYIMVMVRSYMMLRDLLPLLRPDSLDAELLAIDRAIFGITPAVWMDQFNQRPIIEWFSAFYFSYFLMVAFSLLWVLWAVKDLKLLRPYAIGGSIVFFLGQLTYVAVPGYGPVGYLADQFSAPLDGGFFWGLVSATVAQGGAMKDIFPSLHTALPTYFTLFAFYAAKTDPRFKVISRVLLFMTLNIIVSTMLLRWHYAIDVAAGLTLSLSAHAFGRWVAPREARFQAAHGLTSHWAPPSEWEGAELPEGHHA